MKKNMPLEGLRWSRDSGSALYDTPQTAVLGRAGGRCKDVRTTKVKKNIKKMLENLEMYPKNYTFVP